jgi:hypothetical protein
MGHDPNRPEDELKVDADEDGIGGDDAADCLRYLVATKSRVVAQRKLRGLLLARSIVSRSVILARVAQSFGAPSSHSRRCLD